MTHISFDPSIPLAMWVPLAVAAAGLLAWYAATGRRRLPAARWWSIVALMGLAVAVPLVVLLNPTWLERIPPPPGKPLLTILVDRSASMATRDAGSTQTRYQAAVAYAAGAAKELGDRYEVHVRSFADGSAETPLETLSKETPQGAATDLGAAVQDALDDQQPQGQALLVLSDGIHNAGSVERLRQSAARAKAIAAPLYTRTIGGEATVNDLEVGLDQPQELAFVGQRVPIAVSLRHRGSLSTKTNVSLLLDGKAAQKQDVTLKTNDAIEQVFYVSHDRPGLYRYEVQLAALPGEVTTVNNTTPLMLRVVDQPVRVLLLEGKPYWDTKFLIRTLSADQSVELTSVVQLTEGRLLVRKMPHHAPKDKSESATAEPNKRPAAAPDKDKRPATAVAGGGADDASGHEQWAIEKDAGKFLSDAGGLASYQIVILGHNAEAFLTDEALVKLRKWLVESEGALVCFRGPPASQINQRLGELMPVVWTASPESRFRVELTPAGRALRWLPAGDDAKGQMAELPSLATTARPEGVKALTVVLATAAESGLGQSSPVMSYQPVGNGRVVVVEGAGLWRWAFLSPDHKKEEEVYGSLWRSLVRWLAANVDMLPSQRLSLRADKLSFNTGENVTATLLVRDWSGGVPRVTLTGGAKAEPQTFTCTPRGSYPGQYYVALGRLPEGRYSLRVEGIDKNDLSGVAAFDVRGNLAERLDVCAQPRVMKLLAEQSGGAVLDTADPRLLARQFDQHLSRTRPERTAQTMAWDRWWVLAGAFAVWGLAWGMRRRSGLV
jgi:hypothetical protein